MLIFGVYEGSIMRILVLSDSHGRTSAIEKAIEAQPTAKHIFFLGDCVRDIEDYELIYPDRTFHVVSGNCDYASMVKSVDAVTLEKVRILFTHGHPFSVKSGLTRLYEAARQNGAQLVLFGHTHVSKTEYSDGIYFVNPGSLCRGEGGPSYAVVDIGPSGILPIIIRI